MKCERCGTDLRNGSEYCPVCGEPVRNSAYHPSYNPGDDQYSRRRQPSADNGYDHRYNTPEPPQRGSAVKWIVIGISVLTVLVVVATAIFVVFRLNSGMSSKKVYKKYIQVIEQQKDSIAEYENENNSNGVAFLDINQSGIPDVLYITQDDTSDRPYLHCLTDEEKDVEVDREENLTGELDEGYTLFREDDETCLYIKTKDSLRRLIITKDGSGNSTIQMEVLARRTYDESTEEYTYQIMSDSGELKEVSEEEYNEYIESFCGKKITIILSTLSDKELSEMFPDLIDNISEKQDDAIQHLKERTDTEEDQSTPDSADPQSKDDSEDKVETQTEEKDRNFVKDHYLVEYDGVVYYVDDDGLWKKESGCESELLYSCSATNLATDGRVIYYGVFNETVPHPYSSSTIDVKQYDMYKYDLSTGSNEKLTSFIESGKPICAIGDIVYYTDYRDDFDGNAAGLAQGIRSYNTATGEKKYLCDGAQLADSCDGKIFYREIMAAGGNMGVHQIHCYDTQTGDSEIISEDNVTGFKVIGGKLYYIISEFNTNGSGSSQLYCYDISSSETEHLADSPVNLPGSFDDQYIVGLTENRQALSRVNSTSGETEEISLSGLSDNYLTTVLRDNHTTYIFDGSGSAKEMFTVDDDSQSAVSGGSISCESVLSVKNTTVFYIESGDKNYYNYHIGCYELTE